MSRTRTPVQIIGISLALFQSRGRGLFNSAAKLTCARCAGLAEGDGMRR